MSEPTPPSPAPPSAPPPPEQGFAPKRNSDGTPDGQPPIDVRRTRNLYTVVAAFLVFIGVTSLLNISDTATEVRKALHEADPALAEQLGSGMIKAALIMTAILTLGVAIGHGLTSHALQERRAWSRPLGLTFSGILLGLAALNLLSAAQLLPSLFFAISGMLGISLMRRPEVREYLRPRWGGPNGGPPYGGPGGPPHGGPGAGGPPQIGPPQSGPPQGPQPYGGPPPSGPPYAGPPNGGAPADSDRPVSAPDGRSTGDNQ